MRASQLIPVHQNTMNKIVSFRRGTRDKQRAYVWNKATHQTCIYVNWDGDISRYNRPPSMPYTVYITEQRHIHVLRIINQLCDILDVDILVFDPFQSFQGQPISPFFRAIAGLARKKDITVFLMLAEQAPIIQAEVYIDPRR